MCVYETGLLLLFASVALLLLPLSFVLGVGAPSLSLAGFMLKAARRGSLSLFVVVLFGGLCVGTYETGLLLMFLALTLFLFAYYVALLLLPLSLFLGFRAPSLSLGGFVF